MAKQNNGLMSETSLNGSNYFAAGINDDIHELFNQQKDWFAARNAVSKSFVGHMNSLSNEMSNKLVDKAPYTIIGCIYIHDGEWAIFSTDNVHSEIGVFNDKTLKYTQFVNSDDLAFKKSNLINGVGRIKKYNRTIYWDDNLNPSRYLDLDDIPWKGKYEGKDCKEFVYETEGDIDEDRKNPEGKILDIEKTRLSPVTQKGLSFKLKLSGESGELDNGTYAVVGFYSSGGPQNRLTNFLSVSNTQHIFSHEETSGSLEVVVDDVDTNYDEFTLVLLQMTHGSTTYHIIGSYSTATDKIIITQSDTKTAQQNPAEIMAEYNIPEKSKGIYRVGDYIVRIKPTMHQDFNYQKYANDIVVKWVNVRYPMDYYKNGGNNVGYMRDEVYSFFIRWVYSTGDKSNSYHIPGRAYDDFNDSKWKDDGFNTAMSDTLSEQIELEDGGVVVGKGLMAYWESTEKYNDKKPEVWGSLCGKNIRHHKMPDTNLAPHYVKIKNKNYIQVLGVEFSNIKRPTKIVKDENGEYIEKEITDIIGYEILRGSREGNKTILAKGMINNMRMYDLPSIDGEVKQMYYPNYPYNPISNDDLFISKSENHNWFAKKGLRFTLAGQLLDKSSGNDIKEQRDFKYSHKTKSYTVNSEGGPELIYDHKEYVSNDHFTFHSPDMQRRLMNNPNSLAALTAKKLKVSGILNGSVDGYIYQKPKGTPEQKLMMSNSLMVSMVLGLGYTLIRMFGKKRKTNTSPNIDYGGTKGETGYSTGGTGIVGGPTSAAASALMTAADFAELTTEQMLEQFSKEFGSLGGATSGFDSEEMIQKIKIYSNATAGAVGGKGGTISTETEETEWTKMSTPLKIMTAVPMFLSYYGEGINKVLEMLYNFAPYKNHTLQQYSHGFYDKYKPLSNMVYDIDYQSYIRPYIIQMQGGEQVNNLMRRSGIAIKTKTFVDSKPIKQNGYIDKSQVLYSTRNDDKEHKIISSYYASMKQPLANQYGQLQGITQVLVSNNISTENKKIFFGGDTFVGRYTEKNTMFFFTDWLGGNMPDGTAFDYSLYQAIAHPRFWMNTSKYNVQNILTQLSGVFDKVSSDGGFEPFQVAGRFKNESIKYINNDLVYNVDNPEVTYTKIKISEERYKDIDYLFIKDDYNVSLYPSYVLQGKDDEDKQERLDLYNSNRVCSCDYDIVEKIINDNSNDKEFDTTDEEYYQLEKDNYDYITKYNLINYDRFNQYGLNNCEFFKYNSEKNSDDTSHLGKEIKLELEGSAEDESVGYTKVISDTSKWYVKPYNLKGTDFKSLCKLQRNVEKAEFDLAIGKAYIHFLQRVSADNEVINDEEWKDEDSGEDFCSLCWERAHKATSNKKGKRNKKQRQPGRDAVNEFDSSWSDDYDEYNIKPNHHGWYNSIPYTLNAKEINPLLIYFISEETNLQIQYPSKEIFMKKFAYENYTYSDYENIGNGKAKITVPKENEIIETNIEKQEDYEDEGVVYQKYHFSNQNKSFDVLRIPQDLKDEVIKNAIIGYSLMSPKDTIIISGYVCPVENIEYRESESNEQEILAFPEKTESESWNDIFENFSSWKDYLEDRTLINDNGKDYSLSEAFDVINDVNKPLNEKLRLFYKVNQLSEYDKYYNKKDDMVKYWTIEGCRDILNLRTISKKRSAIDDRYSMYVSGSVSRQEKCKNLEKYFSEKGPLYNRIKKLEKNFEKAFRKYNKELNKHTKNYTKALMKNNNQGFFIRLKKAFMSVSPYANYSLDVSIDPKPNALFASDMYMYTFVSGTRDFFVESTQNIDCRNWGDSIPDKFYDHTNFTDLSSLYDADFIKYDENVNIDVNLSPERLFTKSDYINRGTMQSLLYDPIYSAEHLESFPNRIMYSDPDEDIDISDGWRTFRRNDLYDFNDEVTSVLTRGENDALILFKNSSPVTFVAGTELLTSQELQQNMRLTVGSAELFNKKNMRHIMGNDSFEYGSCQDSLSAISSPAGVFYISQDQGKILQYKSGNMFSASGVTELSSYVSGLDNWLSIFMPYMLTRDKQVFAENEYELTDNPVIGIGCQTSYDNTNDVLYFSKKDYRVKPEYADSLIYKTNNKFDVYKNGNVVKTVELGDKEYFDDASFNISYDIKLGKNGSFVSWHDWHPDLVMNARDRIFSTKDNGIYRHNDSPQSYCNFYGEDYPFEVEFTITSDNRVSTLRSISYFLECFTYGKNDYDRFHKLFDNFDKAIVFNTEQISGELNLNLQEKDNPLAIIDYPKVNEDSIDILYSKEEQRYRFDQFWDITNNRQDESESTMFLTEPNGYKKKINSNFVNYNKAEFEHKKFRHRVNKVRLIKTKSGNVNLIFSMSVNHNLNSPR